MRALAKTPDVLAQILAWLLGFRINQSTALQFQAR